MIDQWVFMFLMIALIASNLLGVVVLIWGIRNVSYQQACIISLLKCKNIEVNNVDSPKDYAWFGKKDNIDELLKVKVGRASAPNSDIG